MSKTKSLQLGQNTKIAILAILVSTLFLLSNLFAFESSSFENTLNQVPTAQADSGSNEDTQTPQNEPDSSLTQDFLNDQSPLSKPAAQAENQAIAFTEVSGQGKQCSTAGDASQGSQSCLERNEDGSFAEIEIAWESFGDESKKQTVIKSYTAKGDQVSEETLRVKTSYKTLTDGSRIVEKESLDIVKQPAQGLTTRDLIVRNYEKGQVSKTTWAHYVENPSIGNLKAALAHHAVLYYENGRVKAGFANQYKNGRVVDALLNYNPAKNPNLRMELTGITKWANQIDQLVNQNSVSVR